MNKLPDDLAGLGLAFLGFFGGLALLVLALK